MMYGTEAVIPVEVGEPSFRTTLFDPQTNEQGLALNLDLIEIRRDEAMMKTKENQQAVARSYNPMVKIRHFKSGDFVLKRVVQK